MALMKWSNSSIDDEEEKKDGIIQVKSVQSQWQPTDENQQSQQKTRSEQDYMFSEEKAMRDEQQRQRQEAERQRQEAERQRQLVIAEEQRQNALYAEQQRQANLANQAQQRQQAQAQQNDDYNKRVNEYVGQKIEQERKAWNDARSWSDKLFGQNSYGDTEERRTKANAIAQFKVDNTDWNNAYQVADTQRYAKSASNISNAISQSYGDYLRRADEASKSVGDLPVLGNLARLATTGSGSILDRSESNENIINNVGDIKYKTSIGKNGKQYDVEEMINFVNKGLETNSMTYLEAEELLSQVGMDQRFKIGENNTVEERSAADRTADSSKRIISAVGNPLFSVLENTGKVVGDMADNTVGNLASGAIDMTFGNVQRMLGGDPNTDDDPNSFNALNAGDWSRLAKNLPSGMITGATGAPRKIVEGSGQIISGVANTDLGHTVGGVARLGDGAIDIGGIGFGGSGQMIKAITGELGEQTAKQTARKIVAQLAKGVGQEGLEEGVQDLLGQVADNNGDLSKIDLSRTLEATKQGAVGGALMGGAGQAISGVRGRFDTNMDTQTQDGFENQLNNLGDPSEEFNSNREIVIPAPQNQLQEPNLPAVADTFTQPKQFEPIAPLEMGNFETILGTEPSEVVSDYQSEEAPQTRELKLIEDVPEETAPAVENNAPSVENTTYTPDTITQLQNQYAGADEAIQSKISGDINRLRDISGDNNLKPINPYGVKNNYEYLDDIRLKQDSPRKNAQFELLQKTNPMLDDYHTGIRSVEDIRKFEDNFGDDESFVYPDFIEKDAQAIDPNGKIRVYSSKDINTGDFVTPSKMMAKEYAGGAEPNSKLVNVNDVAWINGDEGNYLPVSQDLKYKVQSETAQLTAKLDELKSRHQNLTGDEDLMFNIFKDEIQKNALGYFDPKTNKINLNDLTTDTLNHEIGHKIFSRVPMEQKADLISEIRSTFGDEALISKYGKDYGDDINILAEERLADGFNKYYQGKLNGEDSVRLGTRLGIPPKVLAYYDRMIEAIKSVFGATDELKKFYAEIEAGKFAENPTYTPDTRLRYLVGGRKATDFSDAENKWVGGDGYDRFEIDDSKAEWKIPIENVSGRKKFKLSDILTHDELYKNYPEFKDMPVSFKKMKLTTGGYYEPAKDKITLNSHYDSKTLLRTILHEIQHRIQQKEGFSNGSGAVMSRVDVLARKRGVSPAEARKEVDELLKSSNSLIEEYNTLLRKKKEDLNGGDKYTKQLEELKTAINQNKQRLEELGLKKASGFTKAGYDSYKRNAGEVEARAVEKRKAMTAEERAKTPFNESFDIPADDVLWDDVFPYKQQPTNKSKTAEDFLAEPDEDFDEDLPIKPKKEKDILDRFISQYDTKEVPFKALINTTLELGMADGVGFDEVITELKNYPKFLDKQGHIKPGAKKIIDRIVKLEKQRAKAQKQVNSQQKKANQSRKGENGSLDLENLKYTTQDQKARNRAIKQKQFIESQMNANVMRLMSKAGLKHAFVNNLSSTIDYRKANMLLSAPSLSRNITQELTGNVANFIDNPTNSIKSLPNSFRDGFSGAKRSVEGWKNTDEFKASPHKYIMGNTYSTAMAGTQALADARFDGARQTIAEEVAKLVAEEKGVKPTKELVEFVKASGGMEMEMVARTMTGVYNASSNRFAADQMMKAYIDFIKNGDEQSHAKFMSIAEKSSTIAQALRKSAFRAKNLSNDGKSASAMMNFFAGVMDWLVPFSATATNAVSNTLYELNPFTQSVYDLFKSEAQNSDKAVVGSRIARHFMTAKVAPVVAISGMFATGMAGYNDSDEDRSKPQGFWIKFGDTYTTPRAVGMDLPFAIIGVAHEMSKDISADTVDFSKYGRMISSSVPYINEMRQTNSWLTDLMSDWNEGKLFDPGYQAQTQFISTTKSLTPFANNNLYPAIMAMNGKMTNQKKMYDKDVGKHFQNMLTKSFATSDEQWNSLEDSRDATGRVRSVDLPLGFGKHEITDEQTKRYNQSVMDMNNISKKYKLGNLVGDNWNTYDEGKSNSNFNTLMGMIARTDESGWKNDHNKLIPNDKLRDLGSQIYQSVFESKGDELLTMGGEQLFSDVKVPNSAGSKNTSLPISMNSIRDTYLMGSLTQEQNDALNAIRTEKDTNYADYSAKKISKDQYLANKDSYATREREILSQSKNYEKWNSFWNDIKETGFFEKDGYGSTKSGQMWLWNALNNMYIKDGNKKTPATNWKDSDSSKSGGYSRRSSGGGNNLGATAKNKHGIEGIENKAKARKMTTIKGKTLTPANIKISLQNKIKKDATRNYKG